MRACQPVTPSAVFQHAAALAPSCRWLWDAFTRPKWSPATHRQHPDAFRRAVRAFLLAAHRGAGGGQRGRGAGAGLGRVPQELLLQVVGAAAGPASAWM